MHNASHSIRLGRACYDCGQRSRNSRPLIPLSDRHRHFEPVSDFVSRSLCNWPAITRSPTEKNKKAEHATRNDILLLLLLLLLFFLRFFFATSAPIVHASVSNVTSRILFDFGALRLYTVKRNGYGLLTRVWPLGAKIYAIDDEMILKSLDGWWNIRNSDVTEVWEIIQ